MSLSKLKYKLIYLLCLLMPMHSMVIDKIVGPRTTGLINLWRDVVIAVLFIVSAKIEKKKMQFMVILCILWILVCMALSLIAGYSNAYLALNTARTYIMPMILYIVASSIRLSPDRFASLIRLIWVESIALTVFGAFQVFVLGAGFLTNLGYGSGGSLTASFYIQGFYGFQRMNATFSSPNDCGLYLSQTLLVSLLGRKYIESKYKRWYMFGMIVILIGIVLTFSRTSFLAVSFCLLVYYIKSKRITFNVNKVLKYATFFLLMFVAALYIDHAILKDRVTNMFYSGFMKAFSKTDASFIKHLEDIYSPIVDVIRNPLGYGFGTNGPVAVSVLGEANSHAVESSIWLMGYEIGIPGIILYYLPFGFLFVRVFRRTLADKNKMIAPFLALCTAIAFLTLPYCSSYESTFLMFLFAGLTERTGTAFKWDRILANKRFTISIS